MELVAVTEESLNINNDINNDIINSVKLSVQIPLEHRGLRLDQALALCFPMHSRMRITQWIRAGQVSVDGVVIAPKIKVVGNEVVEINASVLPAQEDLAESIDLKVVFEDDQILIINKPAGLVVHPGAGNPTGTLLNALLHHAPILRQLPRGGIVHRLDKDTTGLMVVAKTLRAHTHLVAALQRREIEREYVALIGNPMIAGGTIDAPMGRHPLQRIKMAVIASGKPAVTHYRCAKRYQGFTLLDIKLETGRTHQIRVHLSYKGLPIVGDALYGWRHKVPPQSSLALQEAIRGFNRQALHAKRLTVPHPLTQEKMTWEAPLPADFADLIALLAPPASQNLVK